MCYSALSYINFSSYELVLEEQLFNYIPYPTSTKLYHIPNATSLTSYTHQVLLFITSILSFNYVLNN